MPLPLFPIPFLVFNQKPILIFLETSLIFAIIPPVSLPTTRQGLSSSPLLHLCFSIFNCWIWIWIVAMPCKSDCTRTPSLKDFCSRVCNHKCPTLCFRVPNVPVVVLPRPLPRPQPPLPRPLLPSSGHHPPLVLLSLIATATMIGAVFMVCLLFKKLRQYRHSRREPRGSRNGRALFDVQGENPPDDEEGPVLDHHIWYINTVGLQQSVIDSITMFKYRKDEKLIDGTDCSVCLGEFQEDESLRLLPKCSHAFHVPCIDTWLRSHKNCPLCRAPVVSNSAAPNLAPTEPMTGRPRSREDTQMEMETVEEEINITFNQVGGDETSGEGGSNCRRNSEIPVKGLSRTLSALTENQNRQAVEDEGQAIRRSVSLDSVSALAIHQATANIQIPEEGSSSGALVEVKNTVSRNIPFPKRGIGNQSLYNLVKGISFGRSVQKGAIAMKRFSSGSRKLQWSRYCRSQSSVLPL